MHVHRWMMRASRKLRMHHIHQRWKKYSDPFFKEKLLRKKERKLLFEYIFPSKCKCYGNISAKVHKSMNIYIYPYTSLIDY